MLGASGQMLTVVRLNGQEVVPFTVNGIKLYPGLNVQFTVDIIADDNTADDTTFQLTLTEASPIGEVPYAI